METQSQQQQRKEETQMSMTDVIRSHIDESIRQHVRAEVADVRKRLGRIEALLFHADPKTFDAIDAAIVAAKHNDAAWLSDADVARGRSPSSIAEPLAEVCEDASASEVSYGVSSIQSHRRALALAFGPNAATGMGPDSQSGQSCAAKEIADVYGLWSSSLGRINVSELGCKFDDDDVLQPLTFEKGIYRVSDWESISLGESRIDWKHHVTKFTSSWHRLSRCTSDEWRHPGSTAGKEGDIVRLEEALNFVMELNCEPIRLSAGLCGRVIEIDPDGDWLVDFASVGIQQWVLRSNFSFVKVLRVPPE